MIPQPIERLVKTITQLPGIGQRQASRIVFFLFRSGKETLRNLIDDLQALISLEACSSCNLPFDSHEETLCHICRNPNRDPSTIMIVEKETDLMTIEKTNLFKGRYYILGKLVNPLDSEAGEELPLHPLVNRITQGGKEVIFALSPTTAGDLTILQLSRRLKPLGVKTTRLARGLPNGSDVEFTDPQTLSEAIENRK